jgi:hypothetical protein
MQEKKQFTKRSYKRDLDFVCNRFTVDVISCLDEQNK